MQVSPPSSPNFDMWKSQQTKTTPNFAVPKSMPKIAASPPRDRRDTVPIKSLYEDGSTFDVDKFEKQQWKDQKKGSEFNPELKTELADVRLQKANKVLGVYETEGAVWQSDAQRMSSRVSKSVGGEEEVEVKARL